VLEETVAAPIEAQVNGVDDMIYMSSNSNDSGNYSLNVTFAVGTDPDIATVNVQNRGQPGDQPIAERSDANGVTVQKAHQHVAGGHAVFAQGDLRRGVSVELRLDQLKDALARVAGVGKADVMTDFAYGMRIWLDPDKLASLGMTPTDFINAVRDQNIQVAAGQIGAPPVPAGQQFQYTIKAKGRLSTAEEFEKSCCGPVMTDGASFASAMLPGSNAARSSIQASGEFNGKPSTVLAIYQAPGANAIARWRRACVSRLEELSQAFPDDIEYRFRSTRRTFVQQSFDDVITTLFITFLLVVSVVFIFLGNWRATIIPTVAIPVSLIGTFAVLLALGMSLNTISCSRSCSRSGSWWMTPSWSWRTWSASLRKKGLSPKGSDGQGDGADHRTGHRNDAGAAWQCSCPPSSCRALPEGSIPSSP
jgi:HAE1 family hydrophobic/amphiphilic exporter-1